jgi:hypothetical protein
MSQPAGPEANHQHRHQNFQAQGGCLWPAHVLKNTITYIVQKLGGQQQKGKGQASLGQGMRDDIRAVRFFIWAEGVKHFLGVDIGLDEALTEPCLCVWGGGLGMRWCVCGGGGGSVAPRKVNLLDLKRTTNIGIKMSKLKVGVCVGGCVYLVGGESGGGGEMGWGALFVCMLGGRGRGGGGQGCPQEGRPARLEANHEHRHFAPLFLPA